MNFYIYSFFNFFIQMKHIRWNYPENIEQAINLIKNDQALPHGGGVHLAGKKLTNTTNFICLDKLPLRYVNKEEEYIKIGSLTDYNFVAQQMNKISPGHILTKSLGKAATEPLRNRITIGGSLRLAPNWSDLIGPLVALEATVKLEGNNSGVFPVIDYLKNHELKQGALITEVQFPAANWNSWYYREGMVENDHPAFTITILTKQNESLLEDIAIAITGHTKRFMRAEAIESQLIGNDAGQVDLKGITKGLDVKFPAVKGMSAEYLKHLAEIQLERGLQEILKS